ncbi:hypothetical protein [Salinactinospora qingdaonensis]|uniref:UDP-N-acetylglucosamine 1-carboxyvinyltransferase n=1 Tax=Salinactinospora qingdaonensis TaxID=702744 RepID=A0ABP7FW35_9ACTN
MLQDTVTVHGGYALTSPATVTPTPSKNAGLPLLAAAPCVGVPVLVHSVPSSTDIRTLVELMQTAGLSVAIEGRSLVSSPEHARGMVGDLSSAVRIRASYYLVPALLGAYGRADLPWPGGCDIGQRAMDLHFWVYAAFGDSSTTGIGGYTVEAGSAVGTVRIELPFRSRGATVAAALRAVVARRRLVLVWPNRSPEVETLVNALNLAGYPAVFDDDTLYLEGDAAPTAAQWRVPGDKIEIGTLLCAAAATGGRVRIGAVEPAHLGSFVPALHTLGFDAVTGIGTVELDASRTGLSADLVAVADLEPGGLDADFEPLLMVLALGRAGHHLFGDAINPGRHGHLLPQLARFGAHITTESAVRCRLRGPQALRPAQARATDIRTGVAVLLAALVAPGESRIEGLAQVARGHEDLLGVLSSLGAYIQHEVPA